MRNSVAVSALFIFVSNSLGYAEPRFEKPGELLPGSGSGYISNTIFYPNIRFPIEKEPAYANSQVHMKGGYKGGGGSQCDSKNYSYPWRDNFCETRSRDSKLCKNAQGHQGQDIRPSTCKKNLHWTVAADDGVIASIGRYSVSLQTTSGAIMKYLHLDMQNLAVQTGDRVVKGARIGRISDTFYEKKNGTYIKVPTTIHLHFDIKDAISVNGKIIVTYIPPYTSLVNSYKSLLVK